MERVWHCQWETQISSVPSSRKIECWDPQHAKNEILGLTRGLNRVLSEERFDFHQTTRGHGSGAPRALSWGRGAPCGCLSLLPPWDRGKELPKTQREASGASQHGNPRGARRCQAGIQPGRGGLAAGVNHSRHAASRWIPMCF